MKVEENKEETEGTFSKTNVEKIFSVSYNPKGHWINDIMKMRENIMVTHITEEYYDWLEESGYVSKDYLIKASIEIKARKMLETLNTATLHEIRIPVQKPMEITLLTEHAIPEPSFVNNFYIVHFQKYRLTDGSIYWKFKNIEGLND